MSNAPNWSYVNQLLSLSGNSLTTEILGWERQVYLENCRQRSQGWNLGKNRVLIFFLLTMKLKMQIHGETIIKLLFIQHGTRCLTLSRSQTMRTYEFRSHLAQYKLALKINENYIILSTFKVQHRYSFENEQSNIIIFVP